MLVRSKIPSISVIRLKRGLYRSGIRLTINIIVARAPISILDLTLTIIIRRIFVIIYPDIIRTLRRVAVPTKGILRKIYRYIRYFKKKEEVKSYLEVIIR